MIPVSTERSSVVLLWVSSRVLRTERRAHDQLSAGSLRGDQTSCCSGSRTHSVCHVQLSLTPFLHVIKPFKAAFVDEMLETELR